MTIEDSRKKASERMRLNNPHMIMDIWSKPCFQYDLEGNFIKSFKKRKDAEKELNILSKYITSAILKSKSSGGFLWTGKYEGDKIEAFKRSGKERLLTVYDKEGLKIKTFTSLRDCSIYMNTKSEQLSRVISQRVFHKGCYIMDSIDKFIEIPAKKINTNALRSKTFKDLGEIEENFIVGEGEYYLYRHIRLDTDQPFYVGIGTKNKAKGRTGTQKGLYIRAFSKHVENSIWMSIINKTQWKVEILLESDNLKFIMQKEIEFIQLYGRKNLGTGVLANLTNGGDKNEGVVRFYTEEQRKEISERTKLVNPGSYYVNRIGKVCYQYTLEGEFVKKWDKIVDAEKFIGASLHDITGKSHRGFMWFREYKGEKTEPYMRKFGYKPVTVFNFNGDKIDTFISLKHCSKRLNINMSTISKAITTGKISKSYYFREGNVSLLKQTNKDE